MEKQLRVRFAPSPTGFLHVGGLRTALYNYLFAKGRDGKFVLRIEDTDQSRKVEGAVENLVETLQWSGLNYDEGPGKEGDFGPYVQSQRLGIYQTHAKQLIDSGKAYYCFCTQERLNEVRKQQMARKLDPKYDRYCRTIPQLEASKRKESGERCVVRMKVPLDGELTFEDTIRGNVTIAYQMLDDQVLIKSDGYPTYHLGVVVDDHLMQISHVIRGEEWLPSTPKHILLYQYFGWELPIFAHLPLLLNPDKSKLSKRQGDVAVEDYKAKGYLPEAITNFVAFLGWNPGDEREIFSLDQLVKEFSLERVGKSGAVFNLEKLDWLNFQHLRRKPESEVLSLLKDELKRTDFAEATLSDDYLLKIIRAMRDRATFVRDFVDRCPYFFQSPKQYEPDVVKKRWTHEAPDRLKVLVAEFSGLSNPAKEEYEASLHRVAERLNIKNSDLIHPLRLAVSGVGAGPGLFDILVILGKEEIVRRINAAVERLT